ncbi:MAG: tryptophan-rich sensory protein [Chloroflexi bacterium]|nr:tryptophan-rich sensory protein [Chloroflexota bacterium]
MKKVGLREVLNLLAFLGTVTVNGLANALPINGQTTGEISDRFQVYFVPAGYVFSIWGLIYLGLLGFVVYQLLPTQRSSQRLGRIGYWFVLSCLANSLWILLWHYEFFALTVAVMLILLISLIAIYLRLDIGRVQVATAEKWLVDTPFSIYLGWITVATVANVTALLSYWNWSGWGIGAQVWAVIMLVIATALAAAMSLTRRDIAYALVIVWAFVGIAVKQGGTPLVVWSAALLAVMVAAIGAIGVLRRKPVV